MKLLRREIWKPIPNFLGYEVSNLGRVRSFKKQIGLGPGKGTTSIISNVPQKILRPGRTSTGYLSVALSKDGKPYTQNVHVLVLENFVGPRPPGYECNHKDRNKENPELSNLEWVTHSGNMIHAYPMQFEIYYKSEPRW